MPTPRLIHPIEVQVLPADKAATPMDRDAREPIRSVKRSEAITIPAQVQPRSPGDPRWTATGPLDSATGYLLFRRIDLEEAGWTPSPTGGDRVVAIGTRETDLYTLQDEDGGHYASEGGASLVVVYYSDRRPSSKRTVA